MKIELESQDIETIAQKVCEMLRPMLSAQKDNVKDDSIMDVKGLCEYLKVTQKWIHERTYLKEIPYYKGSNKMLRFKKKDIDRWLESIRTPAISEYREN